MNPPEPGSVIDGFRLGEMIHAGSMATIFRLAGADGPLPLVMKIPRLGPGERAVNVIGFEVCRTVLGAMGQGRHHPTLVAYGDVETTPYLVMEFIEGERLGDWLERAPMPPGEVARLGTAMALALAELHRQDVVHLDLKPTNVVFRPGGEAVLIDFGLAHHGHFPDLLAEELRIPVGNWVYMAPEQVQGVRCDPRSDIFALGAILYELATGRLPFGHPETVAELRRRLYRDPVPPRAVVPATPPWLQEIVLRCLEVDPARRHQTAAQLAFDLQHPAQVALTERAARQVPSGRLQVIRRWLAAVGHEGKPRVGAAEQTARSPILLAAVDVDGAEPALLEAVAQTVQRLLQTESGARLVCVGVMKINRIGMDELVDAAGTSRHLALLLKLKHWARELAPAEPTANAEAGRVTFHVLEAPDVASALIDYARKNQVDQIVMGARSSGGLRRFLGSVSARVVVESDCTVTVVRAGSSSG